MPTEVAPGIWCVDVDYVRPGLASSHILVDEGRAAFVDTGTTLSAGKLLGALDSLGIARSDVDAVLLTHVHLDHAGGAGALMRELPNARCVVHPRGVRHLVDPSQLVAGATAVYGEATFRALYGEIVPIDAARVIGIDDGGVFRVGSRALEFLHTPGHALHHAAIADRAARVVFAGDTFGISYRELDTARGPFVFPTTTPVQFDPRALHQSVDRVAACEPDAVILTHFSRVGDVPRLAADMHDCIDGFVEIAERHAASPDRARAIAEDLFEYLSERLGRHGYQGSSEARHSALDGDIFLNAQGLDVWLSRRAQDIHRQA
jgi:glyoxylase-like metal-dependent hydrolase (beta-lactamase superfamily II)